MCKKRVKTNGREGSQGCYPSLVGCTVVKSVAEWEMLPSYSVRFWLTQLVAQLQRSTSRSTADLLSDEEVVVAAFEEVGSARSASDEPGAAPESAHVLSFAGRHGNQRDENMADAGRKSCLLFADTFVHNEDEDEEVNYCTRKEGEGTRCSNAGVCLCRRCTSTLCASRSQSS